MKSLIGAASASALLALGLGSSTPAQASTYEVGFIFSGSVNPGCTGLNGSCLTATFSDTALDTVTLTLGAHLAAGRFIDSFYFNLDPALNVAGLGVAYQDVPSTDTDPTTTANPTFNTGTDAFKADGTGGNFDVLLSWPGTGSGGGVNRFTDTETSIWILTLAGLTADDFDFKSVVDTFFVASHLQGIPITGGTTSVWIAETPLPPALLLFGSGLVGLGLLSRRRGRKQRA